MSAEVSPPDLRRALRCATTGSVDDGKSTLLGRLLLDAKALFSDQIEHLEEASRRRGFARTDLALVTDGLRAEREQGITIDVAWRYFATPARRFVLADAPGHVQYTRNMVTAASSADVAILLVDARHGLVEQTRRHLFVTRLLGVRSIAVVMNKMDQVGYRHDVFAALRDEIATYLSGLDLPGAPPDVAFFPVSALVGDNVVERSASTPWYDGPTLLAHLEGLPAEADRADAPARYAVQWVVRPQSDAHPDYRGYAGRVLSGVLRRGDRIVVWPSGLRSTVARLETLGADLDEAPAGRSIIVHLEDDLDVSRGDLLSVDGRAAPTLARELVADVAWVHPSAARVRASYVLKHGTREVRAVLDEIEHGWDVGRGAKVALAEGGLAMNGIARVRLRASEPVAMDRYADLRATGSFLLIDPASGSTLAAGMLR